MEKGFLKLSRKFFSNKIWKAARTFSECEAWLDLIQSARFEATDKTERIGDREITYGRGQYPASIRFLAKKWLWSERAVRTFLSKLVKEKMITTDNSQGMNIITLCKYSEYNSSGTGNDTGNDTDNNNKISSLHESKTQIVTREVTQQRHTGDTNSKKDKKEEERIKEDTPSIPHREDVRNIFSEYKSDLLSDDFWIESEAMTSQIGIKFKEKISEFVDNFFAWIISTGEEDSLKSLKDAKRRFHYWWANTGKKEYLQNNMKDIPKGFNVWIENGRKYYGSGIEIPLWAPTRPSQDAKWDFANNRWTVSGG